MEDTPIEVCSAPGIYRCEGCDGREDEMFGNDIQPGDGICLQRQCSDIENWKRAARDTPTGYIGGRRVSGATIPGIMDRQSEAQVEAFRTVDPPAEAVAGCVAGAVPIVEEDAEQRAREEAEAREALRLQQVERGRQARHQRRAAEEEALLQAVSDGTAWEIPSTGMMYSSIDAMCLAMYIQQRDDGMVRITIKTPETRVHNFPESQEIVMTYRSADELQQLGWIDRRDRSRLDSGWMFEVLESDYIMTRSPDPYNDSGQVHLIQIYRMVESTKKKTPSTKIYTGMGHPNRRRYTIDQMLVPYGEGSDSTRELAQQLVDAGVIDSIEGQDDPRVLLQTASLWMEDNPDAEISIRISPRFKNQSAMIITSPYSASVKKSKKTKTKSKSIRRKSKSKSIRRKSKSKSIRRKSKSKSKSVRRKSKSKSVRRKSKSKSVRRKSKSKSRRRKSKSKSRRRKSKSKSRRRKSKSKSVKRKSKSKSVRRKGKSKSRRRKSKSKSVKRKSKSKSVRRKGKSKSRRRKSKSKSSLEFEVHNGTERVAIYKTRRGAEIRADRENSTGTGNYIVREILDGNAKHTKTNRKSRKKSR